MDKTFQEAFDIVIEHEGGYVNDPEDPGGETNYGITKRTARGGGYKGDMKDLTKQQAKKVYYAIYWQSPKFDKVPYEDIAIELFEQGVNLGLGTAIINLQNSINLLVDEEVAVDGVLGPITFRALKKCKQETLYKLLNIMQAKRYIDVAQMNKSLKKYIRGWLKRVKLTKDG